MINPQRVKGNGATSKNNEQKVTSNEQEVTSNEKKVTSNEQKVQSRKSKRTQLTFSFPGLLTEIRSDLLESVSSLGNEVPIKLVWNN